jgi:SAM-dependent methyltransferase
MTYQLDQVVPWGRSFEEYCQMFDLGDVERAQRLLGVGDGPAAFNAEHNRRGGRVLSVDPLYAFSAADIRSRIAATYDHMLAEAERNRDEFVWDAIASPAMLGQVRMQAMNDFLDDFEAGRAAGRYQAASLPSLPFEDQSFDLALCSHLLFLYSEQFDVEFHIQAILDMGRIAAEVRIFPLLELGSKPSRHVAAAQQGLEQHGATVDIRPVPYEFQRGGNEMMVVRTER